MPSVIDTECHQFADDTTLLYKFKNPGDAAPNINRQLQVLSEWADLWRVTFNASKTHYMHITTKPVNHK